MFYEKENDVIMKRFSRYATQCADNRLKATVRKRIVGNRLTHENMVKMGMKITKKTYIAIVVDDPVHPMPVKKVKEVHNELEKYNIPVLV